MRPCSYTYRALRRIPTILQDSSQDWVKKEEKFQFLLFSHYSPVTIHCYCSSVTIHDTVHSEFCLFKGGCPLCFEVFSKSSLASDFSSLRTSLLRERTYLLLLLLPCSLPCSSLFTTSLVILQTL